MYKETASELEERIYALIPANPSILEMDSPFGLYKFDGFSCEDLSPSLAQAIFALRSAQRRWRQTPHVPHIRRGIKL